MLVLLEKVTEGHFFSDDQTSLILERKLYRLLYGTFSINSWLSFNCHCIMILLLTNALITIQWLLACVALASKMPKLLFSWHILEGQVNIASVLMDLPDCLCGPHSTMKYVSLITGAHVVTQTAILIPTVSPQQMIILFLCILISVKAN